METMKDLERQELPQDPNLNCCGVLRQSLLVEHEDEDEFTGQLPNIRHHKQHENMAADTDLNEFGRRRVTLAVEQSLAGPMGKVGAETANRTVPLLVAGRGCARRYERFTEI